MKVTKERRAENRAAILDAASRMFRLRGPEGVSVVDVTKAVGLTHGGFYGHFASKDALVAEAIETALNTQAEAISKAGDAHPFARYLAGYLSERHLNDREGGCPIAALGSEMPRLPIEVQTAYARGLERFLDSVTDMETPEQRAHALKDFSAAVGAIIMARALAKTNPSLSGELLESVRPADQAR